MVDSASNKASSSRRLTFKRSACLHIDSPVLNTHVSTREIMIRIITEAQILQSRAFVLRSDVIELLIIPLSPFFNLLLYTSFIFKITFFFIATSRGLASSTAVSLSKKKSVWISFNECRRAETEHGTSVLWRDERSEIKHDIWSRILAGGNQAVMQHITIIKPYLLPVRVSYWTYTVIQFFLKPLSTSYIRLITIFNV